MAKREKQVVNGELESEMNALVKDYIPQFGRQSDITIKINLARLAGTSLGVADRNNLMDQTVKILKADGKFKSQIQNSQAN